MNETEDAETLETRLRTAIGKRPVDAVAREAGIRRQTLRDMLFGRRKRGGYIDTIECVAKACGVDPRWLAFGPVSAAARGVT